MKLSFAQKLWIPLIVALLSLAGTLFFGSVKIKENQLTLRERELMHVSQLALNVVKTQAALADKGLISQEEAQQRALQTIKDLRYGETGYFTILNNQAQVIMHPINAALIGKGPDISDANGVYIFGIWWLSPKTTMPVSRSIFSRDPAKQSRNLKSPTAFRGHRGAG
jgi:methyl-accepting chemotaxis protein